MTSVSIETENYDMSNLTTLPQVTVIQYTYILYNIYYICYNVTYIGYSMRSPVYIQNKCKKCLDLKSRRSSFSFVYIEYRYRHLIEYNLRVRGQMGTKSNSGWTSEAPILDSVQTFAEANKMNLSLSGECSGFYIYIKTHYDIFFFLNIPCLKRIYKIIKK